MVTFKEVGELYGFTEDETKRLRYLMGRVWDYISCDVEASSLREEVELICDADRLRTFTDVGFGVTEADVALIGRLENKISNTRGLAWDTIPYAIWTATDKRRRRGSW